MPVRSATYGRGRSMLVAVVKVWPVRMTMRHWLMRVSVSMARLDCTVMRVGMMTVIMPVAMLMLPFVMIMFMGMLITEEKKKGTDQ